MESFLEVSPSVLRLAVTECVYVSVCVWQAVQMGPGEGVVVTQFQLPDWPEHGRPVSTGAVVEMLDMITKAQMNTGNRAITILCKSVHPLVSVSYQGRCY